MISTSDHDASLQAPPSRIRSQDVAARHGASPGSSTIPKDIGSMEVLGWLRCRPASSRARARASAASAGPTAGDASLCLRSRTRLSLTLLSMTTLSRGGTKAQRVDRSCPELVLLLA